MIIFDQLMALAENRVIGGEEYLWHSFGPDARYITLEKNNIVLDIIYNVKNKYVYSIEADCNDKVYSWIRPKMREGYRQECFKNGVDPRGIYEEYQKIEVEHIGDMMNKVADLITTGTCDDRIAISIDFNDEQMALIEKACGDTTSLEDFISQALANEVLDIRQKTSAYWNEIQELFKNVCNLQFKKDIMPLIDEQRKFQIIAFMIENMVMNKRPFSTYEVYDKEVKDGIELIIEQNDGSSMVLLFKNKIIDDNRNQKTSQVDAYDTFTLIN